MKLAIPSLVLAVLLGACGATPEQSTRVATQATTSSCRAIPGYEAYDATCAAWCDPGPSSPYWAYCQGALCTCDAPPPPPAAAPCVIAAVQALPTYAGSLTLDLAITSTVAGVAGQVTFEPGTAPVAINGFPAHLTHDYASPGRKTVEITQGTGSSACSRTIETIVGDAHTVHLDVVCGGNTAETSRAEERLACGCAELAPLVEALCGSAGAGAGTRCDDPAYAGATGASPVCNPTNLCLGAQCDDGNPCTTDSCDPATGCVYTPIICSDNNPCTTDSCDAVTGCVYTPKSCGDNNACTIDACDPQSGQCTNTPKSCNDNNACTTDGCNPETGACTNTEVTCNSSDKCGAASCDPATGCVTTPIDCDDKNPCTTDSCNPAVGCVNTPITCNDNNACTADSCDPKEGGCVYKPITCDDNNSCTDDSCDPESGCKYTTISCNDDNACTTDTCDPTKGCVYNEVNCCDHNACTTDSCNPETGCVHTTVTCDDGNQCTTDTCDPQTGCQSSGSCSGQGGCTPGYWKQTQHFDSWTAPYTPTTTLGSVFSSTVAYGLGNQTLLATLGDGGGGITALMRHAVAALLNAANAQVGYPYDVEGVINAVNDALNNGDGELIDELHTTFAYYNEVGCPLN